MFIASLISTIGSSPLARGLRQEYADAHPSERIIPARAGFTDQLHARFQVAPDHPRSRGVYFTVRTLPDAWSGSSPLARGLPRSDLQRTKDARIIPARAGFTVAPALSLSPRRDHPRSRGVYLPTTASPVMVAGSSPLARGLPGSQQVGDMCHRIIPARAGFTSWRRWRPCWRRDHPRSRGVYDHDQGLTGHGRGSSPLARGLREESLVADRTVGIIPARAGFTLGDRRDSNGGPPYQGAFAFTGDLGTARLSCGSVVAGQRSTTTPSPV